MNFLLAIQFPLILLWTNIDQSRGNEHLQAAHRILMKRSAKGIGDVRHQLERNYGQLVVGGSQSKADITNLCNTMLQRLLIMYPTQDVVTCVFLNVIWESYARALRVDQPVPDHSYIRHLDIAWAMLNNEEHTTIGPFAHMYKEKGMKTNNACQLIGNARDSAPMKYVVVCRLLSDYIWPQAMALIAQYPQGFN